MTKIYLAENFLEADQIISELEANHIFAKKHEIIEMSLSDSSVKSRRMGHRIAALIMVGVVAVGICLSIIL